MCGEKITKPYQYENNDEEVDEILESSKIEDSLYQNHR
jgi:hypothetical protein